MTATAGVVALGIAPLPVWAVAMKIRIQAEFRAALAAGVEHDANGNETLVLSLPGGAVGGTIRQCLAREGRVLRQCHLVPISATPNMRFPLKQALASWVDITYF